MNFEVEREGEFEVLAEILIGVGDCLFSGCQLINSLGRQFLNFGGELLYVRMLLIPDGVLSGLLGALL